MKPLRHPRRWIGLWVLAIVAVVVVCLMPPPALPPLPDHGDKVEHFASYFLLAFGAVQLFAARRVLLLAAAGLVVLGVGIEIAQGALTSDRSADPYDALANSVGVALGMAMMLTPWRDLLLRMEKRLPV